MKKQNIFLLLGSLIGLLVILAIIGLIAKSLIFFIRIILIIILLVLAAKTLFDLITILKTFFKKKD